MEIIIEIQQFNFGQMVSHHFIENNRRHKVFALSDTFTIENGLLDSSKSIENKCTQCALGRLLIGKHANHKGNIRHVRYWSKTFLNTFQSIPSHSLKSQREGVPTVRWL